MKQTSSTFYSFLSIFLISLVSLHAEPVKRSVTKIGIIVGSVRATTTGKQIAQLIEKALSNRSDVTTEIIYIADFALPFYTDSVAPAGIKGEITDPVLKKWSEKITALSGFIIVSPEYNGGYSAPLKNALDSLYKEWNCKPVGFVGYSGGPTGGASMLLQLQKVTEVLGMKPVVKTITIPSSWKAFDKEGELIAVPSFGKDLQEMVDQLIAALS